MQFLILSAPLMQVAAGTAAEAVVVIPSKGTWRIRKAYFSPNVAAAAHATNYATLTPYTNQAAGGVWTAWGTALTTASVAMAVDTPRELVLLTTAAGRAAQTVVQGGSVRLAKTFAGAGVAIEGSLVVEIEKIPED